MLESKLFVQIFWLAMTPLAMHENQEDWPQEEKRRKEVPSIVLLKGIFIRQAIDCADPHTTFRIAHPQAPYYAPIHPQLGRAWRLTLLSRRSSETTSGYRRVGFGQTAVFGVNLSGGCSVQVLASRRLRQLSGESLVDC